MFLQIAAIAMNPNLTQEQAQRHIDGIIEHRKKLWEDTLARIEASGVPDVAKLKMLQAVTPFLMF